MLLLTFDSNFMFYQYLFILSSTGLQLIKVEIDFFYLLQSQPCYFNHKKLGEMDLHELLVDEYIAC